MINDVNLHKKLHEENAMREHNNPADKFGVHFDYAELCKRLKKIKSLRKPVSNSKTTKKVVGLKLKLKSKSRQTSKTRSISKQSSKFEIKQRSQQPRSTKSSSNLISARSKSRLRSEINLKVSASVKRLKLKPKNRIDTRIAKVYLNNVSIPITKRVRKSTTSKETATSSRRTKSYY